MLKIRVDDIEENTNQFHDYSKNLNEHTMYIKEVESGEIKININNLDTKKARENFYISAKLWKAPSDKTIKLLTFLFNKTIKEGVVVQKLKTAVVHLPIKKNLKWKYPVTDLSVNFTFNNQTIRKINTWAFNALLR